MDGLDYGHPYWDDFKKYMRETYGNLADEYFHSSYRCGKEWKAFKAGIEAREDSIGDTLGEDQ